MQSRVIVQGVPLLVNDVREQVRDERGTFYDVDREGTIRPVPESGPPGTQAAMMVPVREEGAVVGVVQLMSDRVTYTSDQLEVFEALVGQLATAVRNFRLQNERRRLEAAETAARAVATEREQAAHVLDIVGDGIFLVDGEDVIRTWNRTASSVTKLPSNEVLGKGASAVFEEWDGLKGQIPVSDTETATRAVTLPVHLGESDLWLSFVAVRGVGGTVYAFRDVTAERELEQQKADFISIVSHELRTPLTGIYGAAQTLLFRADELPRAQRQALLELVADQAERLTQITAELLLAGRLERGDVTIENRTVDLRDVIHSATEVARARTEAPTVAVDAPEPPPPVHGDPDRIEQVLVNLIDNALKYGQEPVSVTVASGPGTVRVAVRDGGPGIPSSEHERIFEKFYRGGPSLTRSVTGTGLGLYIARELVERMGGRLQVRSAPGSGTTFELELPRAESFTGARL
jgi:signal transduction histidine kinase